MCVCLFLLGCVCLLSIRTVLLHLFISRTVLFYLSLGSASSCFCCCCCTCVWFCALIVFATRSACLLILVAAALFTPLNAEICWLLCIWRTHAHTYIHTQTLRCCNNFGICTVSLLVVIAVVVAAAVISANVTVLLMEFYCSCC